MVLRKTNRCTDEMAHDKTIIADEEKIKLRVRSVIKRLTIHY
jgi:hypothetical protein